VVPIVNASHCEEDILDCLELVCKVLVLESFHELQGGMVEPSLGVECSMCPHLKKDRYNHSSNLRRIRVMGHVNAQVLGWEKYDPTTKIATTRRAPTHYHLR
jgi:hypothetical protein